MRVISPVSVFAIGLMCVWFLGCSSSNPPTTPAAPSSAEGEHSHDHAHDHGHGHADVGPNGGHLIELGHEEYHAEWVHDNETGMLTVFILDGSAKELFPIPATHISIEKKIGDKAETYELVAVDPQGEPAKSAKFEITDKPLVEALKTAGTGVEATLTVNVGDKPYAAKIEHDHH